MFTQTFTRKLLRKIRRHGFRLLQFPRILVYRLLSDAQVRGKPILYQPLLTTGLGLVEFGGSVKIGVFPSPSFLTTHAYIEARSSAASIYIGDGTWLNNGFSAIAEHTSITIGQRVLIGTNVEIFDSDFHGVRVLDRSISKSAWAKPVVIEDDVFLGSNVRIMKGVRIGHGAVVANSSVVVKDIPSNTIAGGHPAHVLKIIEE